MHTITLVLAALVLVPLGACATPSDPSEFTRPERIRLADGNEAVDRGEAEPTGGALEIVMGEFYFEPTIVKAPGGASLRITLVNAGENVHNFESPGLDLDLTLAERERQVVTITVPDQGTVQFECKFHLPRAMRGEVRAT